MTKKPKPSVQEVARLALARILPQLAEFALESGISVTEMELLLRHSAIGAIARLQREQLGRVNVSRISASSGLSRSAVAQSLRTSQKTNAIPRTKTQFTNRVLAAWHRDPKYVGEDGLPAVLPVYGRSLSFEVLAKKHGGGVPVRALLDELLRVAAIELLPGQRIRARSMIAVNRGANCDLVASVGLHATDLLKTLLENLRHQEEPRFIATVQADEVAEKRVGLVRREIEKRSTAFLSDLEETLLTPSESSVFTKSTSKKSLRRVGVTVFYHCEGPRAEQAKVQRKGRKNLRRR